MKKIVFFLFVVAIAMTISSCRKRVYYYYAYCETNHTPWEGPKRKWYAPEDRGDTRRGEAQRDAWEHDKSVHGGVRIAEIRKGMYYE